MNRAATAFDEDPHLQRILDRIAPEGARRYRDHLASFAGWVAEAVEPAAAYTDGHAPPELVPYDAAGEPINRILTNPLWDAVSCEVYRRGIVGLNYPPDSAPFAITFAMGYLLAQSDISLHCPVTMTGAVAYVLSRFAPAELRERHLPSLVRRDGQALTGGTWATERHGGSDVGASTTVARSAGDHVLLDGLKWFTSNPLGGLALATARPAGAPQGPRGLGLYLVPVTLDDGTPNPMRLRRLKEKLGTRGVPTGEVALADTRAWEVAAPPDGLRLMMEALGFSRLHNAMAAIGIERRALREVVAYAAGRPAFGKPIIAYPMVQDEILRILADLEAGTALAFEAVAAFDRSEAEPSERPWMRLLTALAKSMTAEDAVASCRRAMEAIGGNAYTADYPLARLVRDASVLTIWEGPANIQALEVLRLLAGEPQALTAFETRVRRAAESAPEALASLSEAVAAALADVLTAIAHISANPGEAERHARRLMMLMADTLAAALLLDEAAVDYADGDARKAWVVRLVVESRLARPARRGIGPGADWAHRHFAEILEGAGIRPQPPGGG